MRHQRRTKRLGRNRAERRALFKSLVTSLLRYQEIKTTLRKAKEARRLAERMITLGKKNTLAAKRLAYSVLGDHELVSKLFKDIAPRFAKRQGGYTRILQLGTRKGDAAMMAILELTEKDIKLKEDKKAKKAAKAKDAAKDVKDAKDAKAKSPEAAHEEKPKTSEKEKPTAILPEQKDAHPKHTDGKKEPHKKSFFRDIGKFFRNKGGS